MKKKVFSLLALSMITASSFAQNVWTGSTTATTTTGNVGIGISTPDANLSILNNVPYDIWNPSTPNPSLKIHNNLGNSGLAIPGNILEIKRTYKTGFPQTNVTQEVMAVENGGLVKIGTRLRIGATQANGSYANYALSVDGDIIAKRCVIQVSNWADYVFQPEYNLPSLSDVETFISENKHLPGVPSGKEVVEKGVEIGKMNEILMQKVEELTLYLIQMKKENEASAANIASLKEEINRIKHSRN